MDTRDPQELDALLVWLRAPGVAAARLARLIAHCGSAVDALAAGPDAWRECGVPDDAHAWLRRPDRGRIEADRAWLAEPAHHVVVRGDADYPPLLARTSSAPIALFVDGDVDLLWHAQVAIVGSRHATPDGLATATDFASALADAGLAITSGLALGIDGAAHRAALAAGGTTLAVCGTGVDVCYPRRHAGLRAEIAARGAVVSEYPLGTGCAADQFPRRNRIIAGLALGTLVVEAGLESGSLITARLATEQGREVFAIPGSIHSPVKRGCHRLIREGAKLVESAQDVLDELGPLARELASELRKRLERTEGTNDRRPERSECTNDRSTERSECTNDRSTERSECRSGFSRDSRLTDAETTSLATSPPKPGCSGESKQLLSALAHDPLDIDTLTKRSGLTVATVSSMLIALELDGLVTALPGGRYVRSASQATR